MKDIVCVLSFEYPHGLRTSMSQGRRSPDCAKLASQTERWRGLRIQKRVNNGALFGRKRNHAYQKRITTWCRVFLEYAAYRLLESLKSIAINNYPHYTSAPKKQTKNYLSPQHLYRYVAVIRIAQTGYCTTFGADRIRHVNSRLFGIGRC